MGVTYIIIIICILYIHTYIIICPPSIHTYIHRFIHIHTIVYITSQHSLESNRFVNN